MKRGGVCHLTSVHTCNDTRIFHKECVSLVNAGYAVSLIAPVSEARWQKRVKILPAGKWSNRYYRFFVTIPRLFILAVKQRAAVYHFHDPELLLIAPFLRLTGARVIYDIHEDYVTSIRQKSYIPAIFRNLAASSLGLIETVVSAICYQVVAERYYKERFPDSVEVLNYPLLPGAKSSAITAFHPDHEIVFDHEYQWFLYTGNVTVDRGAILQLELLKKHESSAIAYIGECAEEVAEAIYTTADMEGIERKRVVIIGIGGHVPRETIDYYTFSRPWLAGVALFPDTPHYARKELTKFFEYMAAGLPVLSTGFPVWRKIIEENSCGFCVNPAEPEAVQSAVGFLLNNPEKRAMMGERGRKAAHERYNWAVEEKKLLNLYATIIDRG